MLDTLFRFVKVVIKIIIISFICYCLIWYGMGQYVNIKLKKAISGFTGGDTVVTYDSIKMSGYPYIYIYDIDNLVLSFYDADSDVQTKVYLKKTKLTFNLKFEDIKIDLTDSVDISTSDNKSAYTIKWNEPVHVDMKLDRPLIDQLAHDRDFNKDAVYIAYADKGYKVIDNNLNKSVFSSSGNKVELKIGKTVNLREYHAVIDVNGEGSADSPRYMQGERSLKMDVGLKVHGRYVHTFGTSFNYYKIDNDMLSKGDIIFNKFELNTEKSKLSIAGELQHPQNNGNHLGQIDVKINNFPAFIKEMEGILRAPYVTSLKTTLMNMSNSEDQSQDSIDFSIVGNNDGMRYGKLSQNEMLLLLIKNEQTTEVSS